MALDEYTMRKVDEERSDKGSVKLGGGKCNEIVDRCTISLRVSIFELLTGKTSEEMILLFDKCGKSIATLTLSDEGAATHHNDCAEFSLNI
jgi:hypothetical protein